MVRERKQPMTPRSNIYLFRMITLSSFQLNMNCLHNIWSLFSDLHVQLPCLHACFTFKRYILTYGDIWLLCPQLCTSTALSWVFRFLPLNLSCLLVSSSRSFFKSSCCLTGVSIPLGTAWSLLPWLETVWIEITASLQNQIHFETIFLIRL